MFHFGDAAVAAAAAAVDASAVAAKKTIELYGQDNHIRVVNNPIKEEHPDNVRFLKNGQHEDAIDSFRKSIALEKISAI